VRRAVIVTLAIAFALLFVFICLAGATAKLGSLPSLADWNPEMRGAGDGIPRSIRYTTAFKADKAGRYLLLAAGARDDLFKVFIDGNQAMEQHHAEGQVPQSTVLDLNAGQTIHVTAEYLSPSSSLHFGLGIVYERDLITAEARQLAAIADAVVVAVGFNATAEGEGHDRTFNLPAGQDALVEQVVAANPRTIVLLTGGGGMDVRRWLDKVPALLHLYYPGQEGGTAVAQILFGQHNPEGKLPVSFDRSWEESPSAKWYYGDPKDNTTLHTTGADGKPLETTVEHIKYGDKLMVGYRYWTTTGRHPLFPFGYGLSYTTFKFSRLEAPSAAASGSTVSVSFDVANTGTVAGAEVAQLYVSDPSAKVDRPERELKGFVKVRLAPGETRHVTLNLDARAFSYWDQPAHKWTIDPGKFILRVGDSSENTPLSADIAIQ
jgi:beta-glucosidase